MRETSLNFLGVTMTQIALTPECLDIANAYLTYGSAKDTAEQLQIPEYQVVQLLERKDVKDYITGVYLDRGYRNKHKIGEVLDRMIQSKLEEAEESGIYTSRDLLELLKFAHQVRVDEIKNDQTGPTVNIANFGQGNYGQLMERLLDKGPK
jgi:hypothetical protein